jgi:hypothetical protein
MRLLSPLEQEIASHLGSHPFRRQYMYYWSLFPNDEARLSFLQRVLKKPRSLFPKTWFAYNPTPTHMTDVGLSERSKKDVQIWNERYNPNRKPWLKDPDVSVLLGASRRPRNVQDVARRTCPVCLETLMHPAIAQACTNHYQHYQKEHPGADATSYRSCTRLSELIDYTKTQCSHLPTSLIESTVQSFWNYPRDKVCPLQTPCNHLFHEDCLRQASRFESSISIPLPSAHLMHYAPFPCPVCRQVVKRVCFEGDTAWIDLRGPPVKQINPQNPYALKPNAIVWYYFHPYEYGHHESGRLGVWQSSSASIRPLFPRPRSKLERHIVPPKQVFDVACLHTTGIWPRDSDLFLADNEHEPLLVCETQPRNQPSVVYFSSLAQTEDVNLYKTRDPDMIKYLKTDVWPLLIQHYKNHVYSPWCSPCVLEDTIVQNIWNKLIIQRLTPLFDSKERK